MELAMKRTTMEFKTHGLLMIARYMYSTLPSTHNSTCTATVILFMCYAHYGILVFTFYYSVHTMLR